MSWFATALSTAAVRCKRVGWLLFLLGMAGFDAVLLLPRGGGAPAPQAALSSDAPPLVQSNARNRTADRSAVPQAPAAQRLNFSTPRLDLGEGKPNEILRGELTLTNPGDAPVPYSLIKHCGCTELSPRSGTLGPGEKKTVRIGVQLPDHANSEKNTSVEVQTGAPRVTVAGCTLVARCPAPFEVTPLAVDFGSLRKDQLSELSHELRLNSIAGQPCLVPDKLLIAHAIDAFQIELLDNDRVVGVEADSIRLRIHLKARIEPGDYYDSVDLQLRGSSYVMRVPLHVTVVEDMSVVPSTVYLRTEGTAANAQNGRPRSSVRLLVLGGTVGAQLGPISLADGPSAITVDDLGESAPGRRCVRLTISDGPDRLPAESVLVLREHGSGYKAAVKLVKR